MHDSTMESDKDLKVSIRINAKGDLEWTNLPYKVIKEI